MNAADLVLWLCLRAARAALVVAAVAVAAKAAVGLVTLWGALP